MLIGVFYLNEDFNGESSLLDVLTKMERRISTNVAIKNKEIMKMKLTRTDTNCFSIVKSC